MTNFYSKKLKATLYVLILLVAAACSGSTFMSDKAKALEKELDNEISRLQQQARDLALYASELQNALVLHLSVQELVIQINRFDNSLALQKKADSLFMAYDQKLSSPPALAKVSDCADKGLALECMLENELLVLKRMGK